MRAANQPSSSLRFHASLVFLSFPRFEVVTFGAQIKATSWAQSQGNNNTHIMAEDIKARAKVGGEGGDSRGQWEK